jgi:SEC-C motif-containing protein
MMAGADEAPELSPAEIRKQQAKARRLISKEGVGGVRPSTRGLGGFAKKAKRTEPKKKAAGKGFGKTADLLYDRRKPNSPCPCGSGLVYSECCGLLHDGKEQAKTPEALVRARYSAYTCRVPDYLMTTTDPEGEDYNADTAGWRKTLLTFCDDFEFQGLEVLSDGIEMGTGEAKVPFKAKFCQKGTVQLTVLNELSTFRQTEDGQWLYTKGEVSYEAQ